MENSLGLGLFLAVLASVNLNVGKGIQKWKVKIWGKGTAMFRRENLGDFLTWIVGFLLTASATPLYSFALKYTDKSSLVSALNGLGLIALVIFAGVVLREKIGLQEAAGAALVILGTTVMGYFDKPGGAQTYALRPFLSTVAVMAVILIPLALFSWKTNKLFGLVFGSLPGILIGVAMILGDMALVKSGNDMLGQFKNPFPYFAILSGTAALVMTQFAFWRATAMVVVPTINSFVVFTPVVIEFITFGTVLQPIQYAAVAAIIAGVILLTATEKQQKIEAAVPRT